MMALFVSLLVFWLATATFQMVNISTDSSTHMTSEGSAPGADDKPVTREMLDSNSPSMVHETRNVSTTMSQTTHVTTETLVPQDDEAMTFNGLSDLPDLLDLVDDVSEPPLQHLGQYLDSFVQQVVGLHTELCGTTCHFRFPLSRFGEADECSVCRCDELCFLYKDCCPDLQLLEHLSQEESGVQDDTPDRDAESASLLTPQDDTDTCGGVRLKSDRTRADHYRRMVNYCPPSLPHSSERETPGDVTSASLASQNTSTNTTLHHLDGKCRNVAGSVHWDDVRPVTSSSAAGVVYRNKYCAQCHGEGPEDVTSWQTVVTCAHPEKLLSASSAEDAYFTAVKTPGCNVEFKGHDTEEELTRKCWPVWRPIVSTCNQTGLWAVYHPTVERACAMFTSVVLRKYKNVFCALCNLDYGYRRLKNVLDPERENPTVPGIYSFYALLQFDGEGDHDDVIGDVRSAPMSDVGTSHACQAGFVRDPVSCQCRKIHCSEGLELRGNNCSEVFVTSNYFGFQTCARFVFVLMDGADRRRYRDLVGILSWDLQGVLVLRSLVGMPFIGCHDDTTLTVDVQVKVYSGLAGALRDLAAILVKTFRVVGVKLEATSVVVPARHCLSDTSDYENFFPPDCPTRNESLSLGVATVRGPEIYTDDVKVAFVSLYNATFCPHVRITQDEWLDLVGRLSEDNHTADDLTLDVVVDDGQVVYYVCVDDLYRALSEGACSSRGEMPNTTWTNTSDKVVLKRKTSVGEWTPEGLVSVCCTCISLVSLLAVIVTYSLLPTLRTGAGLSTLFMAGTLFVAQALHEFVLEQFEFPVFCTVLALLIHFSWLAAVLMMSVTTLHFFLAVVFPLRAKVMFSSRKIIWASITVAFGLSAIVVAMTVLGNYVIHGDLGYPGDFLCFIRRPLARQLGFGLPMALAVTFNVVLFLFTSVYIRRRQTISSTRHEHVSFTACFRLSVITGATWLSLFLLATPGARPWLEYVCVVLIGLQGFMLALTLLGNRRVIRLWRARVQKVRGGRNQSVSPNKHT